MLYDQNRMSLDIQMTINTSLEEGLISPEQSQPLFKILESIVFHPQLKLYFSPGVEVYNERAIITGSGQIIIPDRLVVNASGKAVIIDYKTGQYLEKHQQQLQTYASVVKQLGYIVEKKILVYIHPELTIKTVI